MARKCFYQRNITVYVTLYHFFKTHFDEIALYELIVVAFTIAVAALLICLLKMHCSFSVSLTQTIGAMATNEVSRRGLPVGFLELLFFLQNAQQFEFE